MGGATPRRREEDEVPDLRRLSGAKGPSSAKLLQRVTRDGQTLFSENLLGEPGAIESKSRAPAPEIGHAEEAPDSVEEPHMGARPDGDRSGRNPAPPPVGKLEPPETGP